MHVTSGFVRKLGDAPELLEHALKTKRKRCMIGTGSMSDPYMHIEEKLGMTRKCLEFIDHYEFGVAIQTKSTRILRDLDLLKSINKKAKCVVQMTMTTYDESLCKILEPNVSTTKERFEALKVFHDYGIPTIVWICPILPFINDTAENMEGLLSYCVEAGVKGILHFGVGVTLREGDREYFFKALDRFFPGMRKQYIQKFGNAYECISPNADKLETLMQKTAHDHGMLYGPDACFSYMRELPELYEQISLF